MASRQPVDERVIGIMPMVIDALNSEEITEHHFEVLGFFAPSLEDYVKHGLFPHKIGTPEYQAVLAIEDPYDYRDRARLAIPKFLVNASGDQVLPAGQLPLLLPNSCRRKNASAMSRMQRITSRAPMRSTACWRGIIR